MIRIFSAAFLSLLLGATLAFGAEKELTVVADATWPPMETLDRNKKVVGYSIDYLKAVAREAGIKVSFRNTPWNELFDALEGKRADIIASSVTATERRRKILGLTEPYYEVRQAVIVPKGSKVKSLEDLDGLKVGGQIGTTGLIETLPDAKVKAVIKSYDEVGLAVEALAAGELDAVICDVPLAKYYVHKKAGNKSKLAVALTAGEPEYYCFAVRKDDEALLNKLNKGIAAVKAKGLDKKLAAEWMGE